LRKGAVPPVPSPFLFSPSLFSSAPFPLPLDVAPLNADRGSGERFSSPQRIQAEPGGQTLSGEFKAKNLASIATIFRSFSRNETSNWGRGGLGGEVVLWKHT